MFATLLRQNAAAPRGSTHLSKGGTKSRERATLWLKHGDFVRPASVEIGMTDGIQTEIDGGDIDEGSEVVIGQIQHNSPEDSASPFLPKLKNDKAK
jgi:HlyD family secretion protein